MTDLEPPLTAPGIHNIEAFANATAPKSQKAMRGIGQAFTYRLLAHVLYAISGIELFGIPGLTPFIGLRAWADELNERANDALGLGLFANAILAAQLTTNVTDGIELSDLFNGPAAQDFGSNWTLSSGGGAGAFAPNGQGSAAWMKSGGLTAIRKYRHNTETLGNHQAVQFLLTELPQSPNGGTAYIYLRGRINAAQNSEVYLRLARTGIRIGGFSGGSEFTIDSQIMTVRTGVWTLQLGTVGPGGDDREFVVYRNNLEVVRAKDLSDQSDLGDDYRGVGLAAEAAARNFATDQTLPGEVDAWAAADRTAPGIPPPEE
ncbi:DUF7257 domain-containing protein [Mycolicibacterium gilvum]|uniref:DUF7257 domain-containing protein n=1 Tax=Mycolicibacterium gilvum TaxID=1804 RepID=UPI0040459502